MVSIVDPFSLDESNSDLKERLTRKLAEYGRRIDHAQARCRALYSREELLSSQLTFATLQSSTALQRGILEELLSRGSVDPSSFAAEYRTRIPQAHLGGQYIFLSDFMRSAKIIRDYATGSREVIFRD